MEALSAFLLNLYRLARTCPVSSFQDEAFDLLAGQLAFDSARWTSGDLLPDLRRDIHHCYLKNEPLELHTAYHEVMMLDQPMLDLLRDRTQAIGVIAYQSAARFASRELASFRQYQRRFAHENVLTAASKKRSNSLCHFRHVSIYRAHEEHRFTDSDRTFMHLALPHMLEAQTVNAAISNVSHGIDGPSSNSPNVADLGGFLLSENASLRALLHGEWPAWTPPCLPSPLWDSLRHKFEFQGKCIVAVASRVEDLVIFRVRRRCPADALSQRELEVAQRIAAGDGHKQIARSLGITPATARNHVQRIHGKLDARNAAGVIAALAMRQSGPMPCGVA